MEPPNYRLDRTCGAGGFGEIREGSMIEIKCLRLAFPNAPPGGQPGR